MYYEHPLTRTPPYAEAPQTAAPCTWLRAMLTPPWGEGRCLQGGSP